MTKKEDNHVDPYFIPLDESYEILPPHSYNNKETANNNNEKDRTNQKNSHNKKFTFITTCLIFIALIIIKEAFSLFSFAYAFHPILSIPIIVLYVLALFLLAKKLFSLRKNRYILKQYEQLRTESEQLKTNRAFKKSNQYIKKLRQLFHDKPQLAMLDSSIKSAPDYHNDKELLEHIEQHFIQQLDQKALEIITKSSQQTALIVAISPVATLDFVLALWRATSMINNIGDIYGIEKTSFIAHFKLLKAVLHQLIFVGASDLLTDQLIAIGTNDFLTQVSTRAGQGLGAGIFNARIGFQAMAICRPMSFSKNNQPSLKKIAFKMKDFITRKL